MSYTDDVARPFSWIITLRLVHRALRLRRFNGFDCRSWGMRLKLYQRRPKRPIWLLRVRRTSTRADQ